MHSGYVDLNQTISILGVSSATIRNWIKHSYLHPQNTDTKSLLFAIGEVEELKKKINAGEIKRLSGRANKKSSQNTFVPDEYVDRPEDLALIQSLIAGWKQKGFTREKVLFSVALNLLISKDLATEDLKSQNPVVKNEIDWWLNKAGHYYKELLNISLPQMSDLLGLVYQSFTAEGNKAESGSYYTPEKIVEDIVETYAKPNHLILDPCCGTGRFLLTASKKVNDPNNIWGFDIDEIAVRLARLNLLLSYSHITFEPHIFHRNTLVSDSKFVEDHQIPMFDLVITNPPWGAHFSPEQILELDSTFPNIKSKEAFSYFIIQGLKFLKKGGTLSFILPESILNIRTHRDVREVLVKRTSILKVKYLNRVFKNVFTPVIRLDLLNESPVESHILKSEKDGLVNELEQNRLNDGEDFILNVFTNRTDLTVFKKAYEIDHTTLANKAEWALGIVTGDNSKFVTDKKTNTNEPIVTGKDIKKYLVAKSDMNFIEFQPKLFQQVAPEYKFRVEEKLFYKFISKELVFAYDDKKTLSLNSANILIPKIPNYPVKTILAFLNSSIFQFLYQKKFGAIKILRGDIEKLPFPIISNGMHKDIEKLVKKLLDDSQSTATRKQLFEELDNLIFDIFKISTDEREYVKRSIKVSDKLLNTF
jgi:SAM-dependent methyltransferase